MGIQASRLPRQEHPAPFLCVLAMTGKAWGAPQSLLSLSHLPLRVSIAEDPRGQPPPRPSSFSSGEGPGP